MSSPLHNNSASMAPPSFASLGHTTTVDNGLDLLSALASGSMPSELSAYPAGPSGMSPLFHPVSSTGQSQHSSTGLSPPSLSPSGNGSEGLGSSPSASAPSPRGNKVDPFMVGFGSGGGCWEERQPTQPPRMRGHGTHPTASSVDPLDAVVGTPYYPDNQQNLVYSGWPEDLPAPDLLRHL